MPGFRFRHSIHARFRDCDLFGHVNNAVYLTYMEEARWLYWRQLMGEFPHGSLPGLILARAECDYIRPIRPGERIDVWLGVTRIGKSSIAMDYEMLDGQSGTVAKGKSVIVTYDYSSAKPIPVPDWCRAKLEEYEGRNLSRV
jgi:acyl-CoA thioester hydrolase